MNRVEIIKCGLSKEFVVDDSQNVVGAGFGLVRGHYIDSPLTFTDIVNAYRSLTPEQGRELALYATKSDSNDTGVILETLAFIMPDALKGLYPQLMDRLNYYSTGTIFRKADNTTRNEIVKYIESLNTTKLHDGFGFLAALAWIGDDEVQKKIAQWQQEWPIELTWAMPKDGAVFAGWELTEDGHRRELCYPESYDLVLQNEQTMPFDIEKCGYCGNKLVLLVVLDLLDQRLGFLGLTGEKIRIAICPICVYQTGVFMEIDTMGNLFWKSSGATTLESDSLEGLEWSTRRLAVDSPRFALYQTSADFPQSQIGGLPNWVQYPEYPQCPKCHQTMMFLLQSNEDPIGDGEFYTFLCQKCMVVATSYQCT